MGNAREPRRNRGPRRGMRPNVEALDGRLLLSGLGLGHVPVGGKLGPFIAPGTIRPRIQQAPVRVDASPAVNQYLVQLLGPESMEPIRAQAAARGAGMRSMLHQAVLAQPFVNTILGSLDTYELLNSPALQANVGFVGVAREVPEQPPVRFTVLEPQITLGSEESTVLIPPVNGRVPLSVTVPNENIRVLEEGVFQVDVPADQIEDGSLDPPISTFAVGALSGVYAETGPVLTQALLTGRHLRGPNTPPVVRGLRMARALGDPRLIPHGTQSNYVRLMRVAIERDAFQPTPAQSQAIADGLDGFLNDLNQLSASGEFTPLVPPETPPNILGGARLGGTMMVTSGAVRDLLNVAASQSGLQLPSGNFPGRIDSGFVIAANGDYGIALSARGPLLDAPSGVATDVIGGDVRVEVTNALALDELNGIRVTEGTYLGSVVSGEITASRTPLNGRDLVTLGAAAGFGTGLDYGTAVTYTRIIPLGNLNALLPQYPPQ